ncbi:CDC27 family protein [Caloramator proteoclasticus]|uniref:Tetratricopeptide repeat-containing protein n=1 Tax=Caloramator proteoclasticus DSM 10124 TaxID=1121262 RepID=A0A1M4SS11_9CLOT|nr:CDC27 family protein [Caloramator proteoclasticus]SHE34932.1 Tetratricopeptide repeat-containing protein [Caloramator proteoclasticus DSM 10124]
MNSYNLYLEAINLYEQKNYKKALNLFLKVLEHQNNYLINYNIGVCYIELNKFTDAIQFLKKSLYLNKYYENTYINLAYCYYKKKDYKSCYRIIKEGVSAINSDKLNNIEKNLFNLIIYGGENEFNKKAK